MKRAVTAVLLIVLFLSSVSASAESGYEAFKDMFFSLFENEAYITSQDSPDLLPSDEELANYRTYPFCLASITEREDVGIVSIMGRNTQDEIESCAWVVNMEDYSLIRLYYNLCAEWSTLSEYLEPDVQLIIGFAIDGLDQKVIVTNQEEALIYAAMLEQAAGGQWAEE